MAEEPSTTPTPLAEISHGPTKFEDFLEKNIKLLIGVSILIAVGVAGFIIFQGMQESKREEAGAALYSAGDIAALRDVMEAYAGSPSAGSAAILIANTQWKDGRHKDSIATLEEFLAANPDHPGRGTAQLTLGSRLVEEGRIEDAKSHLDAVANDTASRHVAPFALILLGDLEKQAGNNDAAKDLYTRAGEDFPDNSLAVRSLATSRIALVGVDAPEKIAPPAPEIETTPATPLTPLAPPTLEVTPGADSEDEAVTEPVREEIPAAEETTEAASDEAGDMPAEATEEIPAEDEETAPEEDTADE